MILKNCAVSLPGKHNKLAIIKEEDVSDLENIHKLHKVDFVSVPYVLSNDDIKDV